MSAPSDARIQPADLLCLRAAIETAAMARQKGNDPFGAVLADSAGNVWLRAENTVVTERDATGHAETNLIREATRRFSSDQLSNFTLFSSTEPCPMCAGAIFWSQVRRVVYGLGQESLYAMAGSSPHKLPLTCRSVFTHGGRHTEVIGPLLENEARTVHLGYWNAMSA